MTPRGGNGRCNALASSHGARIHTSRSSSVVRITGMALGWIGFTTALGAVVRKPWRADGAAFDRVATQTAALPFMVPA
jgi:hypothetical protein